MEFRQIPLAVRRSITFTGPKLLLWYSFVPEQIDRGDSVSARGFENKSIGVCLNIQLAAGTDGRYRNGTSVDDISRVMTFFLT